MSIDPNYVRLLDEKVQMLIERHENGSAVNMYPQEQYAILREVQELRRVVDAGKLADDLDWWKREAEDCKSRLLELAKDNEDLRRRLAQYEAVAVAAPDQFIIPEPATLTNINQLCPLDSGLSQTDFATGWNECRRVAMAKNAVPPIVKGISAQCQGWNACRAAMLVRQQSVTVPTPDQLEAMRELTELGQEMMAQTVVVDSGDSRTLSESELNRLNDIIVTPRQPGKRLRDLMTREPRYTMKPKSDLLQRAEKLAEEAGALAQRVQGEDLRAKVRAEHAEWAIKTFGNTGPVGPLKHLSKEALETAEAPHDLHEWADMQFLFWDAQRKAGVTDEQITEAMIEKLEINKCRAWPEPKDGEPRFHLKDK